MPILDRFLGEMPRPDNSEVGCRYARNTVFGPQGSWIEPRPGSRQLTGLTWPGANPEAAQRDTVYVIYDNDCLYPILAVGQDLDGTGNEGSFGGVSFAAISTAPVIQFGNQDISFPSTWVVATGAKLWAVAPDDLTPTELAETDDNSWQVLRPDTSGRTWVVDWDFGISDGVGTLRFVQGAQLSAPVGSITISSTNDFGLHSVPTLAGTPGLIVARCVSNVLTLFRVTAGGPVQIGSPITFGAGALADLELPRGLTWAPDGDLVTTCSDDGIGGEFYVVKINPVTAEIRDNYPAELTGYARFLRAGGAIQLGPEGFIYSDAYNAAGDEVLVLRFKCGDSGVSDLEIVADLADDPGIDPGVLQRNWAVRSDGRFLYVWLNPETSTTDIILWNGSTLSRIDTEFFNTGSSQWPEQFAFAAGGGWVYGAIEQSSPNRPIVVRRNNAGGAVDAVEIEVTDLYHRPYGANWQESHNDNAGYWLANIAFPQVTPVEV